eukprot:gene24564-26394_t
MEGESPELFAPDPAGAAGLRAEALEIEAAGLGEGRRITGAGATSRDGLWVLATSSGFCRGSAHSMHERWCSVLAEDEAGAVQDYYTSSDRRVAELERSEAVARVAVKRALAARGARAVDSRSVPVLFEPRVAATLVFELFGALSGGAQMNGRSFLPNPLGRTIAADHLDLSEDPFEPWGLASRPFDSEGVAASRRKVVAGGVAQGLFLAARSARRLGMRYVENLMYLAGAMMTWQRAQIAIKGNEAVLASAGAQLDKILPSVSLTKSPTPPLRQWLASEHEGAVATVGSGSRLGTRVDGNHAARHQMMEASPAALLCRRPIARREHLVDNTCARTPGLPMKRPPLKLLFH